MSTLVLNYLTRFAFLPIKANIFNLELRDIYGVLQNNRQTNATEPAYAQKTTSCSCCQWKGKVADIRKNYISFTAISEIELFCPRCNTYMGFVSGDK